MAAIITAERPDTADAVTLITELETSLARLYPAESRHGYSVEKLVAEQVAFFLTRCDGMPAGCGGIKLYATDYGEIKRMYVRPQFRGLGLGRLMVAHLAAYAQQQDTHVLRLEAGIHQQAAINLYEQMGFKRRGAFGEYGNNPDNLFYEKPLR